MVHKKEQEQTFQPHVVIVASKAVLYYARGIIKAEILVEQMHALLLAQPLPESKRAIAQLWSMARRLCGSELYQACLSHEMVVREQAFDALHTYVAYILTRSGYADTLAQAGLAVEDVVQHIIEIVFTTLGHADKQGLDEPAAFLQWVRVIAVRHAWAMLKKAQQEPCLSLDEQLEQHDERMVEGLNICMTGDDPLWHVLQREQGETLRDAIKALRNPRHRLVLLALYLADMDAQELANILRVPVQDVYQWKHRAIKQLRAQPLLQALVEV